jgi:hypothetical protein
VTTAKEDTMWNRVKTTVALYWDPRYVKWLLLLASLIALILGAGAPDGPGVGGSGGG